MQSEFYKADKPLSKWVLFYFARIFETFASLLLWLWLNYKTQHINMGRILIIARRDNSKFSITSDKFSAQFSESILMKARLHGRPI